MSTVSQAQTSRRPERILLGPGPSNPDPRVLSAMARPMVGHLDPEFSEVLDDVSHMLREVFQTTNRLTFAVSATGSAGMEAALVNVLEPGDTAVVCVNGVFGGRMADVAGRAGAKVVKVELPWGRVVPADAVADALRANRDTKVVGIVHAETSTGAAQPMDQIAEVVRHAGVMLVVDTVTSLGGMPVAADAWGADVCYSGTQKCLSVPPGLAPITFSERALEGVRARSAPVQSWYLDVTLLERYFAPEGSERVYHHTAPVSMLQGLHEGLRIVLAEGLEARWRRHQAVGNELAAELESRGFEYVAERRLPMLHCVKLPGGAEEAPFRRFLLDEYGIEVGGGLGAFAGSCWRIGLMGHSCTRRNVRTLLAAIDDGMSRFGGP